MNINWLAKLGLTSSITKTLNLLALGGYGARVTQKECNFHSSLNSIVYDLLWVHFNIHIPFRSIPLTIAKCFPMHAL